MPWMLWLIMAVILRLRLIWRERQDAFRTPDDSWALFLLLWTLVPILFFSAAESKLPGYILPSLPAAALLVAEYLAARYEREAKISWPLAVAHGLVCGLLIFAALSAASVALTHHLTFAQGTGIAAIVAGGFAIGIAAALVTRAGSRFLTRIAPFAVVVSVFIIVWQAAPVIDATQSSRSVAEAIQAFSHEPVPVALYRVSRVQQYGLDFYLNRPTQQYDDGKVPGVPHLLVAHPNTQPEFSALIPGRKVSYLTSIPAQKLELYWVGKE
jgi:4-amino-4-deoxy-L-arabinose transferase-like glycosyltransferase